MINSPLDNFLINKLFDYNYILKNEFKKALLIFLLKSTVSSR